MDSSTAKCYSYDQDSYPCPRGHVLHALTNWANSPPPCVWVCVCGYGWVYVWVCECVGMCWTSGPSNPSCCLPTSSFVCLVFSSPTFIEPSFNTELAIPLQFISLYNCQATFVWFNCLLDIGIEFLVGHHHSYAWSSSPQQHPPPHSFIAASCIGTGIDIGTEAVENYVCPPPAKHYRGDCGNYAVHTATGIPVSLYICHLLARIVHVRPGCTYAEPFSKMH